MSGARQVDVTDVAAEALALGQVVSLGGQLLVVKAVYGDLARADVVHVAVLTKLGAEVVLERSRGDLFDVVEVVVPV